MDWKPIDGDHIVSLFCNINVNTNVCVGFFITIGYFFSLHPS